MLINDEARTQTTPKIENKFFFHKMVPYHIKSSSKITLRITKYVPGVNRINVPPNLRDFLSFYIIVHFWSGMFILWRPNTLGAVASVFIYKLYDPGFFNHLIRILVRITLPSKRPLCMGTKVNVALQSGNTIIAKNLIRYSPRNQV